MGLFGVRGRKGRDKSGATDSGPSFSVDIDPALLGLSSFTDPIGPAPRISRREAIQVGAVKKCRDLICGAGGGLPLLVVDTDRVAMVSDLLDQPERNVPRSVTMVRTFEDVLFEGVAWWRVVERGVGGWPSKVVRLDPYSVVVRQNQKVYYRRDGQAQGSAMEWIPDSDLIRFDSPNDPLLCAGARAIRSALRLDVAAANMAADPVPTGYFKPAEGADPVDDADIAQILANWRTARQNGSTGYVPAALEFVPLSWDAKQLQLAEGRQAAVLEIARHASVDPEELGVSTTSRTYNNAFDRRKAFLDFTLGAYTQAIEDRLSMPDVTRKGFKVRFDFDSFLRSDAESRYRSYELGLATGAITREEIRDAEGRPALTASEAPVPAPAASVFDENRLEVQLDAPASAAQFKVDLEKRTITGLAVPYGVTAQSGGRTWAFSKGTLKYDDVSRVKFLDGHDWAKPIGRAVALTETDAGMVATFKVSATPAGDEALLLAADLVKDGLSVGIGLGGQYEERDGVLHAVAAPLAEISLTPCPAFDNARVTAVAASKEGTNMTDSKVTTPAEVSVTPAEQTAPNFGNLAEQIAAIMIKGKPAEKADEKPEVVSATAALSVTEPAPYRFDGLRGQHEFSTDLFAVAKHRDGEAAKRIESFMEAAFVSTASVSQANVSTLNPAVQRPDMYVDQLDYSTPVYNAMVKGSLTDGTPFVVPKFSSAADLVADHVEGTEPAKGSFETTSQTITPTATSGKVELPREVVDAGGNPQVSGLIWRQVVRAYYEALEAKAVALLDGLTPTAIALSTEATGELLSTEMEAAFAGLHFLRGGDRFDRLVLQQDLYQAIIAARDDNGRPLYPVLAPQNANGTVAANLGSVLVGGKVGVPAWALGASGVVSESSYLFASEDVHAWATPPQRFDFEYQVSTITVAVWGYKAFANTRLEGVREITFDPAS